MIVEAYPEERTLGCISKYLGKSLWKSSHLWRTVRVENAPSCLAVPIGYMEEVSLSSDVAVLI